MYAVYGSEWKQKNTVIQNSNFVEAAMEIRRIRDLREDHDKTQQEIADFLKMHRSVYRRYESGEREVPVWMVDRLADYYRVSTDYLLGRTDDPAQPRRK